MQDNSTIPSKRPRDFALEPMQRSTFDERADTILREAYEQHKTARQPWKAIYDVYGPNGNGLLGAFTKDALSRRMKTLLAAADSASSNNETSIVGTEFTCICGTTRTWTLLLTLGFARCCSAPLPSILKHLSSQVPWAVYIVFGDTNTASSLSGEIEYVGVTTRLSERRAGHNQIAVQNSSFDNLRVSVILGETQCINLFRPVRNSQQLGNRAVSWECRVVNPDDRTQYKPIDTRRTTGKQYCSQTIYRDRIRRMNVSGVQADMKKIFVGLQNRAIGEISHLSGVGIIATVVPHYYRNADIVCMAANAVTCEHSPNCQFRKVINGLLDQPPAFGLPLDDVSKRYREPKRSLIPVSTWTPEFSAEGFKHLLDGIDVYQKGTIDRAKNSLSVWFNQGIAKSLNQPWIFVNELSEGTTHLLAHRHIPDVLMILRSMTKNARQQIFGSDARFLINEYAAIVNALSVEENNTVERKTDITFADFERILEKMEEDADGSIFHLQRILWYKIQMYQPTIITSLHEIKIRNFDTNHHTYIDREQLAFVFPNRSEAIDPRVHRLLNVVLESRDIHQTEFLFVNAFGGPFGTSSMTGFLKSGCAKYVQPAIGLKEMSYIRKHST